MTSKETNKNMTNTDKEKYEKFLDEVYDTDSKKSQVKGEKKIGEDTIKYSIVRNHGNITVVLEEKGVNHVFIKRDSGWERFCAI